MPMCAPCMAWAQPQCAPPDGPGALPAQDDREGKLLPGVGSGQRPLLGRARWPGKTPRMGMGMMRRPSNSGASVARAKSGSAWENCQAPPSSARSRVDLSLRTGELQSDWPAAPLARCWLVRKNLREHRSAVRT